MNRPLLRPRGITLTLLISILFVFLIIWNSIPTQHLDVINEEDVIFKTLTRDNTQGPIDKHRLNLKRNDLYLERTDEVNDTDNEGEVDGNYDTLQQDANSDSIVDEGLESEDEDEDVKENSKRRMESSKTINDGNAHGHGVQNNKDDAKMRKHVEANQKNQKTSENNVFKVIQEGETWVYSAFFETLPNGTSYIRAFGITKNDVIGQVFCHVTGHSNHRTVVSGELQLLPDAHKDRTNYAASQILCKLTFRISPKNVSFTFKKNDAIKNTLPVNHPGKKIIRDFTVCHSVLFDNYDKPSQLLQNWEMSVTLGAKYFYIYKLSVSDRVDLVLKSYVDMGMATVILWDDYPSNLAWYHAQIVAINDCVYRNRYISSYVVVQDLDEVIVPSTHNGWGPLIDSYRFQRNKTGEEYGSFSVETSIFCQRAPDRDFAADMFAYSLSFEVQSFMEAHNVEMYHTLVRSKHFKYPDRTKTFVRPESIDIMGIHYVSVHRPGFSIAVIPQDIAVVQHYKRCIGKERVYEPNILRYFNQFYLRLNEAYTTRPELFLFDDA